MMRMVADIRRHNGVPTMFVNDKPFHGLATYVDTSVDLACTHGGFSFVHVQAGLVDENGVTVELARERIDELLNRQPDSLVGVRSFPAVPAAWAVAHPEECVHFHPDLTPCGVVPAGLPSFASAAWRRATAQVYEEFSRRIHEMYDGRVIIQQFGAGSQGEWGPHGAPDNFGRWIAGDFSPAMHRHFRSWLRTTYSDDCDALRRAWSDPDVTFETALVPGREEQLRTDWFTFRHPLKRQVADYYHAYADAIADCIIAFCEAIKRGTNGETLAGSHAGGFLDTGLHAFMYHALPLASLRRVSRSEAVDTFTSPVSYLNRRPGGSPNSMVPAASLRLHGKFRLQDQDSRTHVALDRTVAGNDFFNFIGVPNNEQESVAVLKRDAGRAILGGYGLWWHQLVKGMYDDPAIQDCAARLTQIARIAIHLQRGLIPDMAVVADERSLASQQCANRLLFPLLYAQRVEDFCHAGISWDAFEFGDFFEPNFPPAKLILMLNLFELSPREIEEIRVRLSGSGAIVVWFIAPGIQGPDGFSPEAVRELTGFVIRSFDAECNPRVSITNYEHPLTRGLGSMTSPHSIGTGFLGNDEREGIFGPAFYVDDDDAITLGMHDGLYRPGLAVKTMDGWTSVYSSSPRLSRKLLRNLAYEAGIHQYVSTEDMITVTPELLLLHGLGAGARTLRFPAEGDVFDLWTGEQLGSRVTECQVTMTQCDTRILYHGKADSLAAARSAAAAKDNH